MSKLERVKLIYGVQLSNGDVETHFPKGDTKCELSLDGDIVTIVQGRDTRCVPLAAVAWFSPAVAVPAPKAGAKPAPSV